MDHGRRWPASLLTRFAMLAGLLGSEVLLVTVAFDGANLPHAGILVQALRVAGPWVLRGAIGFAVVFSALVFRRNGGKTGQISRDIGAQAVNGKLLAAHVGLFGICFAALQPLYAGKVTGLIADALAASAPIIGLAAFALGACSFVPFTVWASILRGAGKLWILALGAVVFACLAGFAGRSLWQPTVRLTFALTRVMLTPFVSGVIADTGKMMIGTARFRAIIAPECSGLEGAGLMLAFTSVWLWMLRREFRFPRALLVIPAGIAILFVLNSARIAALILIGNAGARQIATGGFHSQAGWIAFNAVALGVVISVRRISWIRELSGPAESDEHASDNPTAAYLVPFLAIVAAGMLARAASGGFEWLYALRFVAAAAALWAFRRSYAQLDWRFGWEAAAAGIGVFLLWIGFDRILGGSGTGMPVALAGATAVLRFGWIAMRAAAAVITVPVAEELAFRGYLMRRLSSADFESVSLRRLRWPALVGSSLLFGVMHGPRWMEGTLAGIVYGYVIARNGRIGDAVAAHAITNALIVVSVLLFGYWNLW